MSYAVARRTHEILPEDTDVWVPLTRPINEVTGSIWMLENVSPLFAWKVGSNCLPTDVAGRRIIEASRGAVAG